MRRLPQIARTVGVTGVVIALVAWGGFRLYLQSGHARGMAAAQLTDMLGLPVEVESLSVGTVTSSVLKDGGPVRSDVELKPAAAALTLPDLNVALTDVIGTIHIHDARVDLTDCQAKLADGTITVNGELDFKPQPDILKFNVHASNVDVRRLPAEWSLPHDIEGRLRGRADVTLKVFEKGRVETQGTGRGTVVGAKLGGVPAEMTLGLHTESNRLLFHSE